jgi:hypothetical protein
VEKGGANLHLEGELVYRAFQNEEEDLPGMMRLVEQELSEPYVQTTRLTIM